MDPSADRWSKEAGYKHLCDIEPGRFETLFRPLASTLRSPRSRACTTAVTALRGCGRLSRVCHIHSKSVKMRQG